jgi:hypothetical protein
MTIEIIETIFQTDIDTGLSLWVCWLEISQAGETYLLPATAPPSIAEGDLQAFFDGKESNLFALAQATGIETIEIYDRIRILRAFALVVLDEINILRAQHSLSARTAEQLRTAIKNKLKTF